MFRARIFLLFAAMLTFCSLSFAQQPEIIAQKLYDQLDQAWNDRDVNRLFGFFDQATVWTDTHGTRTTFAQQGRGFRQTFANMQNVHVRTIVKDARVQGGRLVVYSNGERRYQFHDPKSGWLPIIGTFSAEDTWELKGGQWKLASIKELRNDAVVDPQWAAQHNQLNNEIFQQQIHDAEQLKFICGTPQCR